MKLSSRPSMGERIEKPTIAIYSRKSIYTGKGESVQTQIDMCKEYCAAHFVSPVFVIYDEGEGYSGGNTRRPAFQRMLEDARAHKFDVLCCYRLDRISRNVCDFSQTLEELLALRITFVSLKEQFDTSSPMGRAMIYISSVFAQLERDTLAERVRDNVHRLARDGRWLGGNTPTGFSSRRVFNVRDGKKHAFMTLVENPDEIRLVLKLYQLFLEIGSLSGVESRCLKARLVSKNGNPLSRFAIRSILTNPVYCAADADAYTFFAANGYNLCSPREDFDGALGIMPFNRTVKPSGGRASYNDISKWIIAVGRHRGMIPGCQWVRVQLMLDENKSKSYKKPKTHTALLSGLIRCAFCGNYMRPKVYGKIVEGEPRKFAYICETKEHSRSSRCSMKNAPGNAADEIVVQKLMAASKDNGAFERQAALSSIDLQRTVSAGQKDVEHLQRLIADKETQISKLIHTLSLAGSEATTMRLMAQINALQDEIADEQAALGQARAYLASNELNADVSGAMRDMLDHFAQTFQSLPHEARRQLIKEIVDTVEWDGRHLKILLFGEKELSK